ncbi:UNVERIFIED_CONTAM: hypothetical protein Scaly_2429300 [Sesamum calycinum]|uniref:Uncharacterized protein n=1 Tax=Sesamum calycinum TaxID=2727403 RepID=A0AAW2M0T4_9LAMI
MGDLPPHGGAVVRSTRDACFQGHGRGSHPRVFRIPEMATKPWSARARTGRSRGHLLPRDYYSTKKLIRDLVLPIEKINACKYGCKLYWKDDADLEYCKFCGYARSRLGSETPGTRSPCIPFLSTCRLLPVYRVHMIREQL